MLKLNNIISHDPGNDYQVTQGSWTHLGHIGLTSLWLRMRSLQPWRWDLRGLPVYRSSALVCDSGAMRQVAGYASQVEHFHACYRKPGYCLHPPTQATFLLNNEHIDRYCRSPSINKTHDTSKYVNEASAATDLRDIENSKTRLPRGSRAKPGFRFKTLDVSPTRLTRWVICVQSWPSIWTVTGMPRGAIATRERLLALNPNLQKVFTAIFTDVNSVARGRGLDYFANGRCNNIIHYKVSVGCLQAIACLHQWLHQLPHSCNSFVALLLIGAPVPHSPPPHASPDRYVSLSAIYGPTWLGMDSLVVSTLRRFHANNDRYYTLNFPLPITPRAKAEYISHTSLPQQVDSISIELGGHAVWSDSQTAMSRYVVAFTPAFPQRLQILNHRSTPRHPTGLLGFHLQQPDPNLVD